MGYRSIADYVTKTAELLDAPEYKRIKKVDGLYMLYDGWDWIAAAVDLNSVRLVDYYATRRLSNNKKYIDALRRCRPPHVLVSSYTAICFRLEQRLTREECTDYLLKKQIPKIIGGRYTVNREREELLAHSTKETPFKLNQE